MVARAFGDGNRLTGDHRLVERARALDHDTIHGHLFTGPHTQQIAHMDMGNRNIFFTAVRVDAPGCFGGKAQ
ncbi:hypothetical protein R77591_04956 [Ralstonia mannitolilytica]|uniref:Uncharacterized protein n=1 Tax=Ralstonia mannitolilytica TaxID=105219 RepID=A0AAD2B1Q6_9RALS|nr:hypothetical protein R77591_04956 [Ralstonia mannitolilytica]